VIGYALILQHCREELQAELKKQEAWAGIDNARSVVCLFVLIQDLQYNKSDKKRSIMATGKANFDLYLYAQRRQLPDKYYKVFASTLDTINANRGSAGLYPAVFKRYVVPMKERGLEKTGKLPKDLTRVEFKVVKD
jgi:hypothetical protein